MASPHSERSMSARNDSGLAQAGLSAAALAGGQSRRMGTDKALLPLMAGERPMLSLVLERLSGISDDVFVVANDRARYEALGTRVVPDLHPDVGALGGIQAAITSSAHDHCLVVACDMPFLSVPLLCRMANEPRDYDVLVPLIPGDSKQRIDGLVFETLHAIYSKRCLPFIERRIAEGNNRVVGFFEDVHVRTLDAEKIARWDPSFRSFFNANTPEAMLIAAEISAPAERNAND